MASNFDDVVDFHHKFGVPIGVQPHLLNQEDFDFRFKFLKEELEEIFTAQQRGDLAGVADGLMDLNYVSLGTAAWMGLPWNTMWPEVQDANMSKILAESAEQSKSSTGRGHRFDVVKPAGFVPARVEELLNEYCRWLQQLSLDGVPLWQSVESHKLVKVGIPLLLKRAELEVAK